MGVSGKAPADNTATDSHSVSLAKKKIEATEVLGACGANGGAAAPTAATSTVTAAALTAAKRRQRWRADGGNIHGGGGGGGDAHTDLLTKSAKI